MKKALLGGLGILVIIAIAGFAIGKGKNKEVIQQPSDQAMAEESGARIEIVSPSAFIVNTDGSQGKELANDETVKAPITIQVTEHGEAVLHFEDGSIARIAAGSTITVNRADYDETDGSSNVEFKMSAGRLWSKVVELATPDSSWEVETSNAVATVRGTAFDSRTDADGTIFLGSENNVTITPFDPATKERLREKAADIATDKFIELKNTDLKDIATGKKKVAAGAMTDAMKRLDWVKRNREEDVRVNAIIDALKKRGISPIELRRELRQQIRQEIRTKALEEIIERRLNATTTRIIDTLRTTTTTRPTATSSASTTLARPVSLSVTTGISLTAAIPEGKTVQFKALAKFSDGTTKDVTANVEWKVLGPIGTVQAGLFTAQLAADVSEAGEGSGAVIATYAGPAGAIFLGQTPIFKVVPVIDGTNQQSG